MNGKVNHVQSGQTTILRASDFVEFCSNWRSTERVCAEGPMQMNRHTSSEKSTVKKILIKKQQTFNVHRLNEFTRDPKIAQNLGRIRPPKLAAWFERVQFSITIAPPEIVRNSAVSQQQLLRYSPKTSREKTESPHHGTIMHDPPCALGRYESICGGLALQASQDSSIFAGEAQGGRATPFRRSMRVGQGRSTCGLVRVPALLFGGAV